MPKKKSPTRPERKTNAQLNREVDAALHKRNIAALRQARTDHSALEPAIDALLERGYSLERAQKAVKPYRVDLDHYKRLAQHAAKWARGHSAHPTIHRFMRNVPKEQAGAGSSLRQFDIDFQFWLGEILDDIRRDAERHLSPAEMTKYERFVKLLTAPVISRSFR